MAVPDHVSPARDHDVFEDVRSIGVLTASGIGDFLMTVPALRALQATYPEARITVLGDAWHRAFLTGRPGPWADAVAVPRDHGVCRLTNDQDGAMDDFLRKHRGRHDLIVQLHGGGRESNEVVRALRPRFSIGSWTPGAEPLDRVVPYVGGRPELLRWLEVVELAGAVAAPGTAFLRPSVTVTEEDLSASRTVWSEDGPFVTLHVGARDARRCWSPSKFAELGCQLMTTLGVQVLVVGTERDRQSSSQVVSEIGAGAVDLTGRLSLGAMLGLARRSMIFIGNDSGPRHLAAAAGTPSVGIFWVGNAISYAPLVGGADRAAVSFMVECPVCGLDQVRSRCEHDVSFVDKVGVEEVLAACQEAIRWDSRPRLRA